MLKSGLFLMIMATVAAAQPPSDDNIRGILKQSPITITRVSALWLK